MFCNIELDLLVWSARHLREKRHSAHWFWHWMADEIKREISYEKEPKHRWGREPSLTWAPAAESVLSTWPVFLHWRAHLNKQWQWSEAEPFHVLCDPFYSRGSTSIFTWHIPQICGSPPPGTAPRNVLALPLVLRTLWKNALHLNYYVSNDCSPTNVSLITLFDSLSLAIMNACLSFSLSQPQRRPASHFLKVTPCDFGWIMSLVVFMG